MPEDNSSSAEDTPIQIVEQRAEKSCDWRILFRSRNVIWTLSSVALMFIRWQTQLQLIVYRIKAERKKKRS